MNHLHCFVISCFIYITIPCLHYIYTQHTIWYIFQIPKKPKSICQHYGKLAAPAETTLQHQHLSRSTLS